MSNKNKMYNNKIELLQAKFKIQTKYIELPDYFKTWLSEFTKAKGCFSLVLNKK